MLRITTHPHALRFIPAPLMTIALVLATSIQFSLAQSGAGASHPSPFSHALPQLDGAHLRATVVEVNLLPATQTSRTAIPAP